MKDEGSSRAAYCLLLTAYCLLLTAYCLLPTAYRLPPSAFRLPPSSLILHPSPSPFRAFNLKIPTPLFKIELRIFKHFPEL